MLKDKIFESQIIEKSLGERKPKGLNRVDNSAKVTNAWGGGEPEF